MELDVASLESEVQRIVAYMQRHGPLLVFASLFVECIPFAGLAAPGLLVTVAAGFIAGGQDAGQASLLLLAAASGVIGADCAAFWIGRLGYVRNPAIRRVVDKRAELKATLLGQPIAVLLFYQFPPYTRMFAPLLLGAADYPRRRWLGLVGASTSLFVLAFFGLGFTARRLTGELARAAEIASLVSSVFVFALLIWLIQLVLTLRRRRSPASGAE